MFGKVVNIFSPSWAGGSVGVVVALATSLAWSQVPPLPTPAVPPVPDVPGAVQDTTNAAQETVKDATNAAQETAKDATNAAQETAKDATNAAKETAKDAANAAKDTTNAAQETARDATKTAKDAAKDATNAAQDATRDVQTTTRDAARGARNAAQDAARDVRDTARDVNDTARDAARGAREAGREVARDVRATARNWNDMRGADLGLWFNRSTNNGLVIADVAADAALSRFGFMPGDRIVTIAGQPVANETAFIRALLNPSVRTRMNVVVLRNGQQQVLYVDPIVLQQQLTTVNVDPLENFGIILDDRYTDRLIVWRVIPRSPAFYAGIRAGDVITTFGGRRIANATALVQIVQQTQPGLIPIQVTRNGQPRTIEVDLQASQVHTTSRQNLDADANIRTNETYIRSNVDTGLRTGDQGVRVQSDANATLPADTAPVLEPSDRPIVAPTYNAPTYRRGAFRRRR